MAAYVSVLCVELATNTTELSIVEMAAYVSVLCVELATNTTEFKEAIMG